MKNVNWLVLSSVTLFMLMTSCKKDNNSTEYSLVDSEISKTKSALDLSLAYNDTLKMVYDTAKVHSNNKYCIKYDKLYHHNDSMFQMHYALFDDEMYKNGMMMSNYSPSTSMMGGGMMNSGTLDKARMMGDTATVGGYFRSMHQLYSKHAMYHNAIYNGGEASLVDGEITKTKSALDLSQAFNDTLKMVYDTAKIHKGNLLCIKYDKLYHQNDSMFRMHYSLFGDEMYKNGTMMSNYTPSSGMMGGGMMNSGSMNKTVMMGDTATVGG